MRLSTRGRYGVAAMCELAMRQEIEPPVRLRDIAVAQGISESYLEQLFIGLRRAGLVSSTRGAHGGYVLGRPADEITVGEIVRVLEGPIAPVACADADGEAAGAECARLAPGHCHTRRVWVRLAQCMARVLDSVTLGDIAFSEPSAGISQCGECQVGRQQGGAVLEHK
jgi:Rrf2 family protein